MAHKPRVCRFDGEIFLSCFDVVVCVYFGSSNNEMSLCNLETLALTPIVILDTSGDQLYPIKSYMDLGLR